MIVGAGIGVTPVRATLQSIVYYRFKRGIGHSFPDHAYCVWIVNWEQLAAYRFMARALQEAEDELYDMRKKKSRTNENQSPANAYICYPVYPKKMLRATQKDLVIWGPHYDDTLHDEARTVSKETAPFTEIDIYHILYCPESEPVSIGDIIVHSGRPKWPDLFGPIQQHHSGESKVMFCGPDVVAHELKFGKKNQTLLCLYITLIKIIVLPL
ncbi:hypothetical protein RFI_05924 [Reticulomyxa filosa]|uniref:Ferric reductase NAD binding domain-containing protein n=1 Tax=Reticulomyxa filosa TaxID=46433 RepID=X6NYZ2_RETFI|nr:hypothetical protein RFI_05924 [Reticulomyxa filosa]|eukprot:ETO31196.1 hypothetical protein RFI_05924 [Reticulomyxa filosa]